MEHFLSDQSKCHQCSARNIDIRDPALSFSCVIKVVDKWITHLRIAGSMISGLLVAPMMKAFFLLPMPSISVRIWLMTQSKAPPASPLETKKFD